MSGAKNLKKGDLLFREGDPSDVMYVIKSGKIAILKAKGSSEITLAELGPGDMLGEMAFFDNKPRSASARAAQDSVVIELPFKALNAQFKTFPEWAKAIMRTVNNHLRNANMKIKNLERSQDDEMAIFPPHTICRLVAILTFVAHRYGEKEGDAVLVPQNRLRNYTIQIFQQPTHKMDKLMEVLSALGHMKVENLGEGKQKISLFKMDLLFDFVNFYNDYLFKDESKRVTIEEKEMKTINALIFYGKKATPDDKGLIKLNLTQMQNDSMRDLGYLFSVDDVNSLTEKKLMGDKTSEEGGVLCVKLKLSDLETIYPYWEIIFTLRKMTAKP